MSGLSMSALSGLGAEPFIKLTRRGAVAVMRPSSGGSLSGLGADSECGSVPQLQAGENKTCCPGIGWVIYDSSESPYGICERARAHTPSATKPSSSSAPLSSDPIQRVEEMRQRIDARREAQDEERFQRTKQEMQLRFIMGQMNAIQAQEAAKLAAKQAAEAARLRAEAKRRADERKAKRNKRLLIGGVAAVFAARLLRVI